MRTLIRSILALACLALAACDQTRFQSDLVDGAAACEVDLTGIWIADEHEEEASDVMFVAADCSVRYYSIKDGAEGPAVPDAVFRANVLRLGGRTYATVTNAALQDIVNETDEGPPHGFHVFRLDPGRKTMKLYDIDHKLVAKRIIDGKIKGEIVKSPEELRNLITGDSKAMRAVLARERLFSRKPIVFRRGVASQLPAVLRAVVESKGSTDSFE